MQSTGPGAGERGTFRWSGRPPLQEVAPQHEGRGSTPLNEGWSGAPCGIPSGTFIRRWKSISRSSACAWLGLDMFNLGPYENRRPHRPGSPLSEESTHRQHRWASDWLNVPRRTDLNFCLALVWYHPLSIQYSDYERSSAVILLALEKKKKKLLKTGYYGENVWLITSFIFFNPLHFVASFWLRAKIIDSFSQWWFVERNQGLW